MKIIIRLSGPLRPPVSSQRIEAALENPLLPRRFAAMGVLLCGITISLQAPQHANASARALPPDPRKQRLEAFFRMYHCPEPTYVQAYLNAADRYGIDYRLLPAISVRETTCGVAEHDNNRWGWDNGRQSFVSIETGIDFISRQLSSGQWYAGKSIPQKLFTYNPRHAYPGEVQRIMQQIE